MICQYSAYFANQGLVPPTIHSYLSALRIFQVILGFPDPRDHTSIPCLRLLLTGIRPTRSTNPAPSRQQLPITPDILTQIDHLWNMSPWTHEKHLLWATVSVCFFGMFRAGELTVSDVASFNPNTHLTWGDVASNTNENPQFSKCTSCNQRQTSLARKSMFTSGDREVLSSAPSAQCSDLCQFGEQGKAPSSNIKTVTHSPNSNLREAYKRPCSCWSYMYQQRTLLVTAFVLAQQQQQPEMVLRTQQSKHLGGG